MNTIASSAHETDGGGIVRMDDTTVSVTSVDSPLGTLHVAAIDTGVCALAFDDHRDALASRLRRMLGPFFRIETHGAQRPRGRKHPSASLRIATWPRALTASSRAAYLRGLVAPAPDVRIGGGDFPCRT